VRGGAVSTKHNPAIIPCLDFEPDIPEGFQTGDAFLEHFTGRPELEELMPAARQRIERARASKPNYEVSLSSLRRSAGLSQKELASRIGTVQPVISMYESGEREPSLKAIYGLAKALKVSFDDLLPALKNV
jgi:ribosome-binding protein aMBF1 (putative translation factor)